MSVNSFKKRLGGLFLNGLLVYCVYPANVGGNYAPRRRIRYNVGGTETQDDNHTIKGPNVYFRDFERFVLNSDVFVDKSTFINDVCSLPSGSGLLITRPRESGKTLNMDMLKRFVEIKLHENGTVIPARQTINYKFFAGGEVEMADGKEKVLRPLEIFKYQNVTSRYLGKFPVIHISFSDIMRFECDSVKDYMNDLVREVFEQYSNLTTRVLGNDNAELQKCLSKEDVAAYDIPGCVKFLCKVLYDSLGAKPFILVDEYELPVNYAYSRLSYTVSIGGSSVRNRTADLIDFLRLTWLLDHVYTNMFKGNEYFEKGILQGVTPFAETEFLVELTNFKRLTMLDPQFAQHYGFSEEELKKLLHACRLEEFAGDIEDWFKGYRIAGYSAYNPYSIARTIDERGKIYMYWLNTGIVAMFNDIFTMKDVQLEMRHLIQPDVGIVKKIPKGISIKGIEKKKNIFYSVLTCSGYVNAVPVGGGEADTYRLTAPNQELRSMYVDKLLDGISEKLNITNYQSLISMITRGKVDDFRVELQTYLEASSNVTESMEVADFQELMSEILFPMSIRYVVRIVADGRFGHLLLPRTNIKSKAAFIIEYKASKTKEDLEKVANEVLSGINEHRAYDEEIKRYNYVKFFIKVGFSFFKKELFSVRQVDKLVA